MGQSAAAKAQEASNTYARQNIEQARRDQLSQALQQYARVDDQATQKLGQNAAAKRSATSTLATSAGEAGISGNSLSALANEYEQRSSEFRSDVDYNRLAEDDALQWQMRGFNTESQSRLNSLKQPVYPSLIAAGLQIAGAGVNAYGTRYTPRGGSDQTKPPGSSSADVG